MGHFSAPFIEIGHESNHGAGFRVAHVKHLHWPVSQTEVRSKAFMNLQNVSEGEEANATSSAVTTNNSATY